MKIPILVSYMLILNAIKASYLGSNRLSGKKQSHAKYSRLIQERGHREI